LDALDELRSWCAERGVIVALVRVRHAIEEALMAHGVGHKIGVDRIYATLPTAVDAFNAWQGEN
jgi:SulP family sulfate permease